MLRRAATRTRAPPTPALRWHMKDEHVTDAAQGVAEDVPQDVAQDLAFGARAARALLATTAAATVFVLLALRWGRNWAAQWHLARAVGKPYKAPLR